MSREGESKTAGASSIAGARPKVLVVDDIPMFRELIANFLSGVADVIEAEDGASAFEAVRRERPRLIVSDLDMPGMGGDALCRAVREDSEIASTPLLMILPGDDAHDRVRAIRSGADDVLSKPLQRVELLGTAGRFLTDNTVRGLPRVQVEAPVTIFLTQEESRARALNLSRGGMFVRTELPLPTHSEWRVRLTLPETTAALTPTAMVVWRADGQSPMGPGLGMRFVELGGRDARAIDDFVYERTPASAFAPRS
jgi:uncharacterized protein (TIGR02266 family)